MYENNRTMTLPTNLHHIISGTFASEMTESQELAMLIEAYNDDADMIVHSDGTIARAGDTLDGSVNTTGITKGIFASEITESQEIAQLIGAVTRDADMTVRGDGSIVMAGDTLNGSINSTEVSKGTFAAVEQWYKKNPVLFKAEVALMRKRFPDAKYRILESGTGHMVWIVTLNISRTGFCKPWTFMLRYDHDHPNNDNYGGSIKVMLVNPDREELRNRAHAAGRLGVPHLLTGKTVDGKDFTYLCTRRTEDVNDGQTAVTTAAQVTAWAADWALHFETGLRDKTVWNNWCNDAHFRHLMIP